MISKPITESGIIGDLVHDGSGKPSRGMILLGGSEGDKAWSSSQTREFRQIWLDLGYALLSLAYFKAPGLPTPLGSIPLEYFEKAFNWLAAQPEVISDEIALVGA